MKKILIILIGIGVFFLFAFNDKPALETHADYYIDFTVEQNLKQLTVQVQKDVLSWLDIEDYREVSRNGMKLRFRPISNDMFPEIYLLELNTAPISLFRDDRKRRIETKAFVQDSIPEVLEALFQVKRDTNRTFLYKPLIDGITDLTERFSDKKFIILNGDCIEFGLYSFYDYRESPKDLENNFSEIRSDLDSLYGVCPNLEGIEVKLRHRPVMKDRLLFNSASQFMEKYFEEKGASFHQELVRGVSNRS